MHRKFLKRIIGVKLSTCNSAIYGELGRYPLYIVRYTRIVQYFLRLFSITNNNSILRCMLLTLRNDTEVNDNSSIWTSEIKKLLQTSGFLNVWMYPESVNVNMFIKLFRIRLIDIYIGSWNNGIESRSSLCLYKEIKPHFEISPYLIKINCYKVRNIIARLRLSSHQLYIESGRYNNTPRNDRKCTLCTSNDLEDEYHFVICCSLYSNLRIKYLPKYYYGKPSMFKFIELINSSNVKLLYKLSIFCKKAFKLRKELLSN